MKKVNEHILFESVMTYSIDNSNHENNEILKLINLNAETFYNSKIYRDRPTKEKEIRDAILSPSGAVKIIGKAGTGKTTVTTKVLREFGDEYIFNRFDIKKDTKIENPLFQSEDELTVYLNRVLLGFINKIINNSGISRDKVLEYYLLASGKSEEHIRKNIEFTDIEGKLLQVFFRQKKYDKSKIIEWIKACGDLYTNLDKLLDELYHTLTPENMTYFLINGLKKYKSAIFFWDNVDSINDDKIRTSFFNIINKYQNEKSDCISIVISFRSNNPSLIEMRDVGSFMDKTIDMDLIEDNIIDDIGDDEDNEEEPEPDFSGLTQKQIFYKKRKYLSKKNEKFFLSVLRERVSFLSDQQKNLKEYFDIKKINYIKDLTFSFLNDKHFSISTSTISNYDRREGLKILSGFINFLVENGHSKFIDLIEDYSNRMIIYESYFYCWLANNTLVFSNNIKNILTEYNNWSNDIFNHNGCLSDIQLMTMILNSTGSSTLFYSSKIQKLTIGGVVTEFKNIGITREDIVEKIFRIYKDKNNHLGLIELSRYYGIDSPEEIMDDDEIWLTPRGENYILYTNLKYTYIYSLLEKDAILTDEFTPVSMQSFEKVLSFLIELGRMYIHGLVNIKSKLRLSFPNKDEAFWIKTYYSSKFCITRSSKKDDNFRLRYPFLHFQNIIASHLKYMGLLKKNKLDTSSEIDINIPYQNYLNLSSNFESLVDEVIKLEFNPNKSIIEKKLSRNIKW